MSLDVTIYREIHSQNITHNLTKMASVAGLYEILWNFNENGCYCAEDMIDDLKAGIDKMESDPEKFKKFDSPNGWGKYEDFLPWLKELLKACQENPDCFVEICK